MYKSRIALPVGLLILSASVLVARAADEQADRTAITRAVLNYCESAYEVKPENIDLSVHPELTKIGFIKRNNDSEYRRADMNFQQLRELVSKWNSDGHIPSDAIKDVVILDMLDQVAVAKLTAYWGVDYFHLAKFDGQWKIIHVIWQTVADDA